MIKPRRIKRLFSSGGLLSFREASASPGKEPYVRRRPKVSERRLSDEMTLVGEVARIVTSNLEIEQVYQQFFRALRKLVDYDRGGLTLLDPCGETYSVKHLVLDAPSRRRVGDQVTLGDSYSGEVISIGRSIVRGTIPADSAFSYDQACIRIGIRSIVAVPLVLDGLIAGTIAIASRQEGAYGFKEQVLLERLAKQLAPTMAKARLAEQSEKDQQALRASEKWFRTLVEQAADPIYLVNLEGRFLDVNYAACTALQYSREELLTMSVTDISVGVTPQAQKQSWLRLGQGEALIGEAVHRRKDGSTIPVELHPSLIELGSQKYKLVLARDLTERKRAEEAQRVLTEENLVMAEIGRIINSSLDIDEVYERFTGEVRRLIPFDRINVSKVDMEAGTSVSTWVGGQDVPGAGVGVSIPIAGTFAEQALRSAAPIIMELESEAETLNNYPNFVPHFRSGLRAFLAVPLYYRDESIGMLHIRSKQPGAYSQHHLGLAERIGNQIASAFANAQLFAERSRLAEENSAMAEIGRVISSSLDINDVYGSLAVEIRKLIPFDHLAMSLINSDRQTTSPTWALGTNVPGRRTGDEVPLDGSLAGAVAVTRLPILVEPSSELEIKERFPLLMPAYNAGLRSFLTVPLIERDVVIGVLQIRSVDRGVYNQRHLDLLESIGDQIAGAVANSQLYAERTRLADENQVMAEISRILSASPDIGDVFETFATEVKKLISFDKIGIGMADPALGTFTNKYVIGAGAPNSLTAFGTLTGLVVKLGKSILFQTENRDEVSLKFPGLLTAFDMGMRSFLAVPLFQDNNVIGALSFRTFLPNAYGDEESRIAVNLSHQIAGAIGNSQMYADRKRLVEESSVLSEIGRIIGSSLDISEVYEGVYLEMRKLAPFDRVVINLADFEQGTFTNAYVSGVHVEHREAGRVFPISDSFAGHVMKDGNTHACHPSAEAELIGALEWLQPAFRAGLRSFLTVPLVSTGEPMGVMRLSSATPDAYTVEVVTIVERIAAHITPALENARLYSEQKKAEEVQRRLAEESSVMAEIGRIISSSLDISEVYEGVYQEMRKLVPFDRVSINLADFDQGTLTVDYVSGTDISARRENTVFPIAGSFSEAVFKTGLAQVRHPSSEDELIEHFESLRPAFRAGLRSMLAVPLITSGATIGVIRLNSLSPNAYTPGVVEVVERIAAHITPALENARLYSEQKKAEEVQRRLAEESAVMAEIGRIIGSSLDISEVYEEVYLEMRKLVPFDRVSINLADFDQGTLTLDFVSGIDIADGRGSNVFPIVGSFAEPVFKTGIAQVRHLSDEGKLDGEVQSLRLGFQAGLRSVLAVPLVTSGATIGIIRLSSLSPNAYTPGVVEVVERIAAHITPALENARLYSEQKKAEEVQRRLAEESAVMAEIGRIIGSSLEISEVYSSIYTEMRKLAPFDRISFNLMDLVEGTFTCAYMTGTVVPGKEEGHVFPITSSISGASIIGESSQVCHPSSEADLTGHLEDLRPYFQAGLRSFLAVPLVSSGVTIGVIRLNSATPNIYVDEVVELVERIAALMAPALENARLYGEQKKAEEVQRRLAEESAVMAEISRIIGSSLDMSEVYEGVYREMRKLVPFDRIAINLANLEEGTLTSTYVSGTDVENRKTGHVFPIATSFAGHSTTTGCTQVCHPASEDDLVGIFDRLRPAFRAGLRSMIGVPLMSSGAAVGVLGMHSCIPNAYPAHVVEIVERIAALIAPALENARLYHAQKKSEQQALESLREKEVLLQEINHRVKNNLQIISSLLNLQSRGLQDGTVRDILQESQSRIRAMSLIHEQLYLSDDLSRIDFGDYLRALIGQLQQSHGLELRGIGLKIDAGPAFLPLDTAIPCGLIVNELVSNSMKHAFVGNVSGEIRVSLIEESNEYSLVVTDNGVGFPEGFDLLKSDTLGLKLVNALVGQLGGTIELHRDGGSVLIIKFPSSVDV